jgi:hypothetical protein
LEVSENAIGRYAGLVLFPKLFSISPSVGVGYGNYIFYRTSYEYARMLPIVGHDAPENFYLQTLMEMGIIGFAILIVLVVLLPFVAIVKRRQWKLIPFFTTFVIYLTVGISTYYQMWLWLFVVIAFSRYYPAPAFDPVVSVERAPKFGKSLLVTPAYRVSNAE